MTVIESGPDLVERILLGLCIAALIPLFIVLSRPAWDGAAMEAQFKSDCAKRGGVLLTHKGIFGVTYDCESRLDK